MPDATHEARRQPSALQHLAAGGLGGLLADVTVHPLLTVKARMQVAGATGAFQYSSTVDALRQVLRTEGAAGLYKGASAIVWATPACGLYFLGYETAKKYGGDNSIVHAGSGFFAQMCGSLVWVPTDVIKERLQVQKQVQRGYESYVSAVRTIVREDGALALYRGYWPHQLTFGPFNAIYFACYERAKAEVRARQGGRSGLSAPVLAACAISSGAAASVLTAPMDNVKTRLQIQGTPMAGGDVAPRFRGAIDCLRTVLANEGAAGFFRGTGARVLSMAPKTMITMTAYETVLQLIMGKQ